MSIDNQNSNHINHSLKIPKSPHLPKRRGFLYHLSKIKFSLSPLS